MFIEQISVRSYAKLYFDTVIRDCVPGDLVLAPFLDIKGERVDVFTPLLLVLVFVEADFTHTDR